MAEQSSPLCFLLTPPGGAGSVARTPARLLEVLSPVGGSDLVGHRGGEGSLDEDSSNDELWLKSESWKPDKNQTSGDQIGSLDTLGSRNYLIVTLADWQSEDESRISSTVRHSSRVNQRQTIGQDQYYWAQTCEEDSGFWVSGLRDLSRAAGLMRRPLSPPCRGRSGVGSSSFSNTEEKSSLRICREKKV